MPLPFFNLQATRQYARPVQPPTVPSGLFGIPAAVQAARNIERNQLQRELATRLSPTTQRFLQTPPNARQLIEKYIGFRPSPIPTDPQAQIEYYTKQLRAGKVSKAEYNQRVKQLAPQIHDAGTNLATVGGGVLRTIARGLPTLGASAQQLITRKPVTLKPNRAGQFIFGKQPIESIQESARKTEESHPGGFGVGPFSLSPKMTGALYSAGSLGLNAAMAAPILKGTVAGAKTIGPPMAKTAGKVAADEAGFIRIPGIPDRLAPKGMLAQMTGGQIKKVTSGISPSTEIGIAPFRDISLSKIADVKPHFSTAPARKLEAEINKAAIKFGLKINKSSPSAGIWESKLEPSYSVTVRGTASAADSYGAHLGKYANQQAVIIFRPGTGDSTKYILQVKDMDSAIAKMHQRGIQGGTVDGNKLVIVDFDNSLQNRIIELSKDLGVRPDATKGLGKLIGEKDYDSILAGARGARGRFRDNPSPQAQTLRAFPETVRTSPFTPNDYAQTIKAMPLKHRPQGPVIERAFKDIQKNPLAAFESAKKPLPAGASDYEVAKRQLLIGYLAKNKMHDLADEVLLPTAETATETARALAMFGAFSRSTPTGIYSYVKQFGASDDVANNFFVRAGKIAKITNPKKQAQERFGLLQDAARYNPSPRSAQLIEAWRGLLLLNPITQLGNIIGTAQEAIQMQGIVNPLATAIDVGIAGAGKGLKKLGLFRGSKKLGQRSRTWSPTDVPRYLEGQGKGIGGLGEYAKTGYDPRNPMLKYDVDPTKGPVRFSKSKLGNVGRAVSQAPFRMLGAADQPFWYGAQNVALKDLARTAAKNKGLKGDARKQFIEKFITKGKPQTKAAEEANYAIFANPTKLGQAGSGVANLGWFGKFTVPFARTPGSIGTRLFVDRSPLGIAKAIGQLSKIKTGQFDQRLFTQTLANSITGTTEAALLGKYLTDKGLINLNYPSNPSERKRWELEGRQSYSIRFGKRWLSLNYIQPFGSVIAYGAAYSQARKKGQSVQDAIATATGQAGRSLSSQSFVQGLSRVIGAVQEPERKASTYVESAVGGVNPTFIRGIARSTDPKQRQVEGVKEALMAGIPGLRQKLTPRQTAFGEDVPRSTSFWSAMFNPARPSDVRGGPLEAEMRRLADAGESIVPPSIDRDFLGEGQTLTKEQIYDLNKTIGPAIKERWQKAIDDPRYKALSDEDKSQVLSAISKEVRKQVKATGKVGDMKDYVEVQRLEDVDEQIRTKAGPEVLELYKLSKTKLKAALANNPNRETLEKALLEYDSARVKNGFIKKGQYVNGLYSKH